MNRLRKNRIGAWPFFVWLLAVAHLSCRIGVEDPAKANPPAAGTPSPANGAQDVKTLNLLLAWHYPALAGKSGIRYDIFLTKTNPPQTVLVRDYKDTTYTVATLDPGVTYYWRVDYLEGSALKTGPVWSFTTTSKVNRKPVFTGLKDTTIQEGQLLQWTLSAPDPDGDSVSYSMVGPQGATLTGKSFAWTPTSSQSGRHQIRFVARDNGVPALSDTANIAVTVVGVNHAPVMQALRDTAVNEGPYFASVHLRKGNRLVHSAVTRIWVGE